MRRIDSSNVHLNKFGPGKNGFQGGNPSTNTAATFLTETWHDSVQEEIANVIEGLGAALDPNNNAQMLQLLLASFMLAADFEGEIGKISYVPAMQASVNHLPVFGVEVNRVGAYAKLWAFAQASGTLVTDAVFGSRPGCFSYGGGGVNGTTFRVPKIPGLVIKSYHNGDGTYTTNTSVLMGAYMPDQVLIHRHGENIRSEWAEGDYSRSGNRSSDGYNNGGYVPFTDYAGSSENTVRSVVMFPQIRYK
jgi:hypothetical protein